MIDLDMTKAVLFDFEDVLCVPTIRSDAELNWLGKNPFAYCVAPNFMKKFVEKCKDAGIIMGLLVDVDTYLISASMIKWVEETYGVELNNYTVSAWKQKSAMLHRIHTDMEVQPEEILLVDSNSLSLKFAATNGFSYASPAEVAYYMEGLQDE